MYENWDCNGPGPHMKGEVRVYPLGGGANSIYCRWCWRKENLYRYERGRETGEPAKWPQLDWNSAKVYKGE